MARMNNLEYRGIVGPILKKNRERKGMSQAHLGRLCKTTSDAISRNESSENLDPGFSTVMGWCRIMGPEFANEIAELMFKAAKQGLHDQRDHHMQQARDIAEQENALVVPSMPINKSGGKR